MKKAFSVAVIVASCVALLSCSNSSATVDKDATPQNVTLLAYDAFTPEKGIFDDFTASTGASVTIRTAGDTGAMVSKAILTAGKPEADVMWGVDNTLLSRAQKANLLTSYQPVDTGDVCVNFDKTWFTKKSLAVPTTLEQLAGPKYKGLLAVQDPVASSPGLAFLLGTIAHFGSDQWQSYWKDLVANGVHISPDWTTAYESDFTKNGGKFPLVVSYGSSPPAEAFYSQDWTVAPPTGVIEETCFRQTEYVGILRGTKNPNIAAQLVNYLLAKKFQESMPLSLFVFPVHPDAQLPKVFEMYAVKPASPLTLSPSSIEKNRDAWLNTWRTIVLS
jgi:thiamine transport system substrate-binding protein